MLLNSCVKCIFNMTVLKVLRMLYIFLCIIVQYCERSSGGRVVKLLACGARGPGIDSRPRHLNFQKLVISCFQVEIWLKDCLIDNKPQNNQPKQYCEPNYEHIWMSAIFLDLSQIFIYYNHAYFKFLVV